MIVFNCHEGFSRALFRHSHTRDREPLSAHYFGMSNNNDKHYIVSNNDFDNDRTFVERATTLARYLAPGE